MARPHTIEPIPGVKDVLTLIEFVRDADKIGAKIAEMEALRVELNKLIEATGQVDEIKGIRLRTAQAEAAAAALLEQTKAAAATLRADAEADAAKRRSAMSAALTARAKKLDEDEATIRRREKEVSGRAAVIEAAQTALAEERDALETLRQRVEADRAETQAMADRLRQALVA